MSNVTVCCRIRPRVGRADNSTGFDAVKVEGSTVQTLNKNGPPQTFTFDAVFPPESTQQHLFEKVAKPIVEASMNGYNSTLLAYGQTGSGKTHTMMGTADSPGIIPRVVGSIFDRIEESPDTNEFTIRVSCLEIYMERVRDLLNPEANNLAIREDKVRGVFVEGAVEEYVASPEELLDIVRFGNAHRAVGATGMNDTSSRSHSVVVITLEVRDTTTRALQVSKLSLVDLAGSESVGKTHAEGQTLDEAKMINKSLFNLAKVINALTSVAGDEPGAAKDASSVHIPYRDSKLTRLLQDSLGGNARTSLIICGSPCSSNLTETLSALRFGTRAKYIKNKPVVNRVRSVEELERLLSKAEIAIDAQQKFIELLQMQLLEANGGGRGGGGGDDDEEEEEEGEEDGDWDGGEESDGEENDQLQEDEAQGVAAIETAASSPLHAPAHHGEGEAAAAQGGQGQAANFGMAQFMELGNLRDEVKKLRSQQQADAEELQARQEEIKSLTSLLTAKEASFTALQTDMENAVEVARKEGIASGRQAFLTSLHEYTCPTCTKAPFLDASDPEGVALLHSAACFREKEAAASHRRLEERAAVLQTEVNDLKTFISTQQTPSPRDAGTSSAPSHSRGGMHVEDLDDHRSAPHSRGGASSDAPQYYMGPRREVVDVRQFQELQGKLTSLIHVHRQLLRKYAVVDVECGEMGEALRARDERLEALTKSSIAQASAFQALREEHERQVSELRREHAAQLLAMRRDLLPPSLISSNRSTKEMPASPTLTGGGNSPGGPHARGGRFFTGGGGSGSGNGTSPGQREGGVGSRLLGVFTGVRGSARGPAQGQTATQGTQDSPHGPSSVRPGMWRLRRGSAASMASESEEAARDLEGAEDGADGYEGSEPADGEHEGYDETDDGQGGGHMHRPKVVKPLRGHHHQ